VIRASQVRHAVANLGGRIRNNIFEDSDAKAVSAAESKRNLAVPEFAELATQERPSAELQAAFVPESVAGSGA
jgi:hypothetical protein